MRQAPSIGLVAILACPVLALALSPSIPVNAGLFGLFGGKSQPQSGWMLHKQSVSLQSAAFKGAERPCENWSWVAGITDMAQAAGVSIGQQYLVDRLYGGSVCMPSAGGWDDLAQRISHDYVLADGQKFRFAARFSAGAPSQADPLIVALKQNRPLMLIWRGHAYLLTGMIYDEYIAPTGNKMFIVTELKLFDPIAEEGKREVSFARDRDNPDDLNGMLELSVSMM